MMCTVYKFPKAKVSEVYYEEEISCIYIAAARPCYAVGRMLIG